MHVLLSTSIWSTGQALPCKTATGEIGVGKLPGLVDKVWQLQHAGEGAEGGVRQLGQILRSQTHSELKPQVGTFSLSLHQTASSN